MSGETEWNEMVQEWREGGAGAMVSSEEILRRVRWNARVLVWMAALIVIAAMLVVVLLTGIAVVKFSLLTFTFAVIAWSGFLPVGLYVLVYRRDLLAETLDSKSMLEVLLRKQRAKRELLEFMRVLLGVETILSAVFWMVFGGWAWRNGLTIFLTGVVVTGLIWRWRNRVEGEVGSLMRVQRALEE